MFCRNCGKELLNNSNYCPNCGTKLNKDSAFGIGKNKFIELIEEHKKIAFFYVAWILVNLGLFIFSKPKGHVEGGGFNYSRDYDYSGEFYPFSCSIGDIFEGKDFYINILFVDRYDFSELFFYTILLPLAIFGMVRTYPYISVFISNMYALYQNKTVRYKEKKIDKNNTSTNVVEKPIQKHDNTMTERGAIDMASEVNKISEDDLNNTLDGLSPAGEGTITMPLFKRFVGSLIDKVFLLAIFLAVFAITDSSFITKLILYLKFAEVSPSDYSLGTLSALASIEYGYYSDNFSPELMERITNWYDNLDISDYLKRFDLKITFSFILLNIIYYLACEFKLKASFGKFLLGGVLIDNFGDKISMNDILIRAFSAAVLMTLFVGLRFLFDTNYFWIILLFFFVIDIPIFFNAKSLIDIFARVKYVKRPEFVK